MVNVEFFEFGDDNSRGRWDAMTYIGAMSATLRWSQTAKELRARIESAWIDTAQTWPRLSIGVHGRPKSKLSQNSCSFLPEKRWLIS